MNNKIRILAGSCCIAYFTTQIGQLDAQAVFAPGGTLGTSTGNFGVGTNNPGAQQEIYRSAGASPSLFRLNTGFAGGNSVDFNPFITGINNGGFELVVGGNRRLVIDTTGNVGIGTVAPDALLACDKWHGSSGGVTAIRLGLE